MLDSNYLTMWFKRDWNVESIKMDRSNKCSYANNQFPTLCNIAKENWNYLQLRHITAVSVNKLCE
jgi:hypothetical protein